jgi:hypothetical protein
MRHSPTQGLTKAEVQTLFQRLAADGWLRERNILILKLSLRQGLRASKLPHLRSHGPASPAGTSLNRTYARRSRKEGK